jgi:hypothetical protein
MVTQGEVEVLDGAAKDPEHAAIAVLGPGSSFGEKSPTFNCRTLQWKANT